MNINDLLVGICHIRAVREVNVRSVLIPVVRIGAVCTFAFLQHPDRLERIAGVFGQLVDVGRIRIFDVMEHIVRIHLRQLVLGGDLVKRGLDTGIFGGISADSLQVDVPNRIWRIVFR